MRLLLRAMVCLVLLSTGAQAWQWPWASADEMANKLFVEAVPLWTQYQALSDSDPSQYEERLELLMEVDANLKSILQDYPESLLAVELASSGAIKQLNQEQIEGEIRRFTCASDIQCVLQLALKTAEGIADDFSRTQALAAVSEAQAASGDVEGAKTTISLALKTAESISDVLQTMALAAVSEAQAASGDVAGATITLSLALKTADDGASAVALAAISRAQAGSGDVAGALKTAERIADDGARAVVTLAAIAEAMAKKK